MSKPVTRTGGAPGEEAALSDERRRARRRSRRCAAPRAPPPTARSSCTLVDDGVDVERPERAQVDHLDVDALLAPPRRPPRAPRAASRPRPRPSPAGPRAPPPPCRAAPCSRPRAPRPWPRGRCAWARRRAPDRGRGWREQQPLGVVRVGRADHLEPGGVDEQRLGRLRVVVPAADAAAVRACGSPAGTGTGRRSGSGTWPARRRSGRTPGR